MVLKLKANGKYNYKNRKEFNSYIDENNVVYIEKVTTIDNYQILKKVAEVASDSENLLGIKAFYQDKKNLQSLKYLVELKEAKTLADLIELKINLTNDELNNIIYQVASGLKTLHDNQILHRDIKPDNIIICKNNLVQLIDYDISRIYKPEQYQDTKASGTKGFIAPELYVNQQTDVRSDIYSFGKTIELLVKACSNLEYEYNEIISKAIEMNPNDRYQSVDKIMDIVKRKHNRFFPPQLEQIEKGRELGLTDEQINIYARSRYNARQMGVIKHALNEKIDPQVIKIICDNELSSRQMWQIKTASKNGIAVRDIKKFAKAHYTVNEMTIYRLGLEQGQNSGQIKNTMREFNILLNANTFSDEQLIKLRQGLYIGLNINEIKVYAHDFLSPEKMQAIIDIIQKENT